MPGSGMDKQIGYGLESTWGTKVATGRFHPLVSESLTKEIGRIESEATIAGAMTRRSAQWAEGNKELSGSVGHELNDHDLGLLFRLIMGDMAAPTGAGPFVHVATPGPLESATIQVGKPSTDDVVNPFTFWGCMCTSWEIACSEGQIASFGADWVAQDMDTTTALAAASYATALKPLSFNHLAVTLEGVPVEGGTNLTVRGDNALKVDRRFFNAGGLIAKPKQNDYRVYSGSVDAEFQDMSLLQHYLDGDEMDLVITFALGTNKVEFATHCRFDGQVPTAEGRDILTQTIDFTSLGVTTDAEAMTVTLTNQDATP